MNGRFDEKLARIAFGDASPEEIAKIERKAQTDPAAALALAQYRQMKAQLRQLADTPAHQLSNERLREAILARGLHPEPLRERATGREGGLGVGWLWMPAAAALLGVMFVNARSRSHIAAVPKLVINTASIAPSTAVNLLPMIPTPKKSEVAMNDVVKDLGPAAVPASVNARTAGGMSRHSGHRHRRTAPRDGDMFPNWVAPSEDTNTRFVVTNLGETPAPPKPPVAGSPIVLIDSDPDAQTGAPGATEVGTASNVVIGG